MTKNKKVVYQDDEYVIFEDGSGGAIMSDEEIEEHLDLTTVQFSRLFGYSKKLIELRMRDFN